MVLLCAVAGNADIYDGLQALGDSLRAWEGAGIPASSALPAKNLGDPLPGARMEHADGRVRLQLPPLPGLPVPSGLWADTTATPWAYSVDVDTLHGLVTLDGRGIAGLAADAASDQLVERTRDTLVRLRLLSAPGTASPPAWGAEDVRAHVKLVGREVNTFEYSAAAWWHGMARLAAGMTVHAHLLQAQQDSTGTRLDWVVFLVSEDLDAPMLHSVQLQEQLAGGDALTTIAVYARLVPGVRLDNIADLFAPGAPARADSSRWLLRIGAPR
ncbi:MAG: hypothetical protein O2782_07670 [bacterium]|nr:hypothetical protein [bacterium]